MAPRAGSTFVEPGSYGSSGGLHSSGTRLLWLLKRVPRLWNPAPMAPRAVFTFVESDSYGS